MADLAADEEKRDPSEGQNVDPPPEVTYPEKVDPANEEKIVQVSGVPTGRDTPGGAQVQVSVISGTKETPMLATVGNGAQTKDQLATGSSVEELKQEKRNRKPLWYCVMVTKYPKSAFAIALSMHMFMVFLTMTLLQSGYDILPINFNQLPLDIRDDTDYLRGLAWQEKTESSNYIIDRNELSKADQTERSVLAENVELFFEKPGGNVFTQANLRSMKDVEEKYYTNEEFQTTFCQLDDSGVCLKPDSVLRYFDGTYVAASNVFRPDENFERIVEIFHEAETNSFTKKHLQKFLGRDALLDSTAAVSEITRSSLPVGKPLKGFANDTDREEEQNDKIKKFMLNQFKPLGDDYFDDGVGEMDFFYNSPTLLEVTILSQVIRDMALAMASMSFIVIFMCFQTGSLWISIFATASILCGFFTTNVIYRVVLDFRYFGVFHVLAIFIILGIGADDVFIMFDTWKESGHQQYPSLAHRLSDVYRKASFAMLFTSLTTALAFIVSAFSPFLGVSTFGVFSGILVGVNYLSIILFFPTVIITYHLYWDKYKCCCCCPRAGVSVEDASLPSKTTSSVRQNPIVRFFRGPYYRAVTHKVARWCILGMYAAVLSFFIYWASELKVSEEQVKFLKDSSNFGKYLAKRQTAFRPTNTDSSTRVLLVWGMEKQDISDCHHTDPECYGKNRWDENFNLNSAAAQNALMDLCDELRLLDNSTINRLAIGRDLITHSPAVKCFIKEIDSFLQAKGARVPVGQAEANSIMVANPTVYDPSKLGAGFNRFFEIAMSYWLYDGFEILSGGKMGNQYFTYGLELGESLDPPHTQSKDLTPSYKYYYGTKMSYAVIAVNTTLQYATLGYPNGLPIRDAWEDFFNEKMSKMPSELRNGFQLSAAGPLDFNLWHWLKVQKKLVSNAVTGIVIGVCFALPVLIIATMNVIVGLLSTGIIICITVTVLGLIPLGGWKLGLLESLNLVLVVGLSVDYVVHLAEGYSRSSHVDRKNRVRDALEEVGISVLSGAITTLGASMFLLFAQILFFTQFGIFMFGTIGFSIFYALGLFITVMGLIGPQGEFGSLKPLVRKIRATCCKPKN